MDHINPSNSLVNVRDQFAYYSLQCLCPNQVSEAGLGRPKAQGKRLLAETPLFTPFLSWLAPDTGKDAHCLSPEPLEAPGQGSRLMLSW